MGQLFKRITIWVPYLWLLALFLLPFLIVLRISFSEPVLAMPPYAPQFDLAAGWDGFVAALSKLSLSNFQWIMSDTLYTNAYLSSLRIAGISTIITLLVGFPLAYGMARAPLSIRPALLMLVILPFWTSFLIRVYAWIGILKPEGLLNQFLASTGLFEVDGTLNTILLAIDNWLTTLPAKIAWLLDWIIPDPIILPLQILNTDYAVFIGIVYSYLPFMVLPIYAALEKMDYSLVEAAQDLGCTPLGAFWKVTARLAIPGIMAGCFLVFIPAIGEFVIPDLLGGARTLMIGKTLWSEFFNNRDWPVASAVAIVLLLILVVPIVLFQNAQARASEAGQ